MFTTMNAIHTNHVYPNKQVKSYTTQRKYEASAPCPRTTGRSSGSECYDWPLPISLLVVIIHLLAASKLPLNPPPLAHNEVQQHPQQNQTQEHDPAVAHRSRHRCDIPSVEDSLALNSPVKTHLAHLVVDETLRHRHADGRPEVLSQSLLRRVVEEVVRLANGRHRQQAPDDQSNRHKRMLRDRTSSHLPTARSTACSSGRTRSAPRSRR